MNSDPSPPETAPGPGDVAPSGIVSGSDSLSRNSSHSHGLQSFGQYSQFLRTAVADEESLQVGESLQALAIQIEAAVSLLQQRNVESQPLSLALIDLVGDLRTHRAMLLALGADWHRFYEFDAHFAALNNFRVLVTQWALEAAPPGHCVPALGDFDLAAWRVLGAGSLLLDVYEQARTTAHAPDDLQTTVSAWSRWSAWWKRRQLKSQLVRQAGRRGRRKSD